MEYAVIYLIFVFAISFSVLAILFAILFACSRISKRNKHTKVEAEALNLFKVSVEIDRTPPNEKIHKNSE